MLKTMQNVKMLQCPACGEFTLHPKRKELGYHVCVNCSSTDKVVGITTVEGSGDHTWNDIIIMPKDKAMNIARKEAEIKGKRFVGDLEMQNFEKDEQVVSQTIKEKVDKILDENIDSETIVTNDTPNDPDMDTSGLIKGIDY